MDMYRSRLHDVDADRMVGVTPKFGRKLDKVIVIYLEINKCTIREMHMASQF